MYFSEKTFKRREVKRVKNRTLGRICPISMWGICMCIFSHIFIDFICIYLYIICILSIFYTSIYFYIYIFSTLIFVCICKYLEKLCNNVWENCWLPRGACIVQRQMMSETKGIYHFGFFLLCATCRYYLLKNIKE